MGESAGWGPNAIPRRPSRCYRSTAKFMKGWVETKVKKPPRCRPHHQGPGWFAAQSGGVALWLAKAVTSVPLELRFGLTRIPVHPSWLNSSLIAATRSPRRSTQNPLGTESNSI